MPKFVQEKVQILFIFRMESQHSCLNKALELPHIEIVLILCVGSYYKIHSVATSCIFLEEWEMVPKTTVKYKEQGAMIID